MFDLESYMNALILSCRAAFGERLLYVGLQGSYLRGEAHENSDIDVMVILNRFSVQDMDRYREILKKIGFYEESCGFICGRDELLRWNPLEVCQLRHTTKDLLGVLTDYLPSATQEDEVNYVKLSLGNLYHELCHRYIHADRERNVAAFRGTCKAVFFLMQNLHYLETGHFIRTKKELNEAASAEDRRVLELAELPDGFDFNQAFSALFAWCQSAFLRVERLAKKEFSDSSGSDFQMEKLTENMIRWAESKLGSTAYAGWCLAFIEDALEISNQIGVFGGDSAKESCELYRDALRGGVPERGAFVFYDCLCPSENGPVNWGHCGIGLGDGRVIHAWNMVRIDDYLAIEQLTALTGDHPEYLGWVPLERVLNQKPYQGRVRE